MYLKKIIKLILILFVCYFTVSCLYGLIYSYPSRDTIFIQKNLTGFILTIFSFFMVFLCNIYCLKICKESDFSTKLIISILCNVINSIMYFFTNLIIVSFQTLLASDFIIKNAYSMLASFSMGLSIFFMGLILNKFFSKYLKKR